MEQQFFGKAVKKEPNRYNMYLLFEVRQTDDRKMLVYYISQWIFEI